MVAEESFSVEIYSAKAVLKFCHPFQASHVLQRATVSAAVVRKAIRNTASLLIA